MSDRSLVLDANILIRAVLGQRVRKLIQQHSPQVALYAPDTAFLEAEEHLRRLRAERGLPEKETKETYESVSAIVQELPQPMYGEYEAAARARIERVDVDDWPVIACALALECPIWTEDRDFFGAGVSTWTTDRVELYLANAEPAQSEKARPPGE